MELLCFLGIAAAVFINGFTDAPNAMATAVCTRALRPVTAAALGGVCNFLGVLVMYRLNSSVADTISSLVRIPPGAGQAVVLAALLTIALWGFFGWTLGVPTSESHGLIAGLTGGALAVNWSLQSVDVYKRQDPAGRRWPPPPPGGRFSFRFFAASGARSS